MSAEVGRVISQLEIYDQVWHARGDDAGNGHSRRATGIVKEIVQYCPNSSCKKQLRAYNRNICKWIDCFERTNQ